MKITVRLGMGMVGLLCSIALSACSDETTVATPDGKVTVKKTENGLQVKTKDGAMSMEENKKTGTVKIVTDEGEKISMNTSGGKLVEGFPPDVPVYTEAKIKMSQLMEDKHAVAALSTGDKPEHVLKYYKAALKKNGWELDNEITLAGMLMLQGTKNDRNLNVQITREGDETEVTIAVSAD